MKTETREIYTCDFCKKYYKLKRFAQLHEKRCFSNPVNDRHCFFCINMEFKKLNVYIPTFNDSDNSDKRNCFYCKLLKTGLIPPIARHRNNQYELDIENIDMPIKCDHVNKDYIGQKMLSEGEMF